MAVILSQSVNDTDVFSAYFTAIIRDIYQTIISIISGGNHKASTVNFPIVGIYNISKLWYIFEMIFVFDGY